MKLNTAVKIEKMVPYVASVLVAGTTLTLLTVYGKHCDHVGYDAGTSDAIKMFGQFNGAMLSDFLEVYIPPQHFMQ